MSSPKFRHWPICLLALLSACGPKADSEPPPLAPSLFEARHGFVTKLLKKQHLGEAVPKPPTGIFDLVKYRSPIGEMSAYVSHPPKDGLKHPIILWVVGGFSNSIGDDDWTPGEPDNDQSASVFREAGVLMMYPSFRGGNDNPGSIEILYGEVDDLLAARLYAAKLPFVDPTRIYLGGHSTGGTLVLLAAEYSSAFRAVFSFGPVGDPRGYGTDSLTYNTRDPKESDLRSPIKWLDSIQCPTFVLEGDGGRSNIASLHELERANRNAVIHFHPIPKATHFSGLRPVSRLIARKILQDTGADSNIAFTPEEIAGAMAAK